MKTTSCAPGAFKVGFAVEPTVRKVDGKGVD